MNNDLTPTSAPSTTQALASPTSPRRGRPAARTRRAVGAGLVAGSFLLLTACGSGSDATPTASGGTSTTAATATTAGDLGDTSTSVAPAAETGAETVSGATIRVVNLYAPGQDVPGSVVVVPGQSAGDDPEPIETIAFGETSDYFEPPAPGGRLSFSIYPEGAYEDSDRLMQVGETMVEGDQATLLLTTSENSEGPTGATLTTFETVGPTSSAANVVDEAPSAGGLVLGNARALDELEGPAGPYRFGIPGQGCLQPTDGSATLVGGTATVPFAVDPGAIEVAAYASEDESCASPVVGPASVDLAAGDRAYVLVYGSGAGDRQLLVLPIG